MKVRLDEDLCVCETSVEICPESCVRGERVARTNIAGDKEPPEGWEAIEVCTAEAIIQSWKQLRRGLLRPSASKDSLIVIH
jgi:hypothetical protein